MKQASWRKRLYTTEFGFDVDGKALESFISSLLAKEKVKEIKKQKKYWEVLYEKFIEQGVLPNYFRGMEDQIKNTIAYLDAKIKKINGKITGN